MAKESLKTSSVGTRLNMTSSSHRPLFAGVLALLVAAPLAHAQYIPAYPGAYVNNPYRGPGGALAGQAELVSSVGKLNIDQEKARVEREAANQAKLDTQKKSFDQMLYERSLLPT